MDWRKKTKDTDKMVLDVINNIKITQINIDRSTKLGK